MRIVHWLLAVSIAGAWLTRSQVDGYHEVFGYVAAGLVAVRLLWSMVGNRYARVSAYVRSPKATLAYLRQVLGHTAARYIGHNPLGGWMALLLWSCVAALAVSGWALNTDLLWGYAWPVRVHVALGWSLLVLIGLHLAGVVFTSWQHRENLVAAMVTGQKNPASGTDVD